MTAETMMLRLWNAFFYSLAGLRAAWNEPAARLEIWVLVVAIPLACWLPLGTVEKLLLIGCPVALFVVEILNTSVEAAIDRISAARHPLSKLAKDLGSAAVFVAAVFALVVWLALAGPVALKLIMA
jgi:diacylglycerol kinase (ATP)